MTALHTNPPARGFDELRASIDRFIGVARRRRRTFLLVFVLAVVTIQAVAFVWPGTFDARAAVLLQKTRMTAGVDADPSQPTTVVTGTVTQEEVNSEIAVLTSRQVLDATIAATGLDRLPPPWYIRALFAPLRAYEWAYSWMHGTPYPTMGQRALAGLASSIDVQRLRDSNILVITYRAGDPRFAEVVLNELLKQYLEWHVAVHSQMDVQPFFSGQAEVLSKEVTGMQEQLHTLKARLGVGDVVAERESAMLQDAQLREEAMLLRRQLGEFDGKIAVVNESIGRDEGLRRVSATTRPGNEGWQALRAQILELELEEIRLAARFTDASPLVRENQAKLAAARRVLDEERRNVAEESTVALDPTRMALQQEAVRYAADRSGTDRRLRILEQQIEDSRKRIATLDGAAAEADRLQLQLDSAKERYLMYLNRTEKARVDGALDRSRVANVSVVQYADAPLKPSSPKRLITLIISIIGGLIVALFVCAWLELAEMGIARTLASIAPAPEEAV